MTRISALIRRLARDTSKYEESCKVEWTEYREDHPSTKQTEGDFVQKCVDKRETKKDTDKEKAKEKRETEPEPDTDAKKVQKLKERGVAESDAEAVVDHDLSANIDLDELNEALDAAVEDDGKDSDDMDVGEKLHWLAEKLVEVVDIDEYVEGMPDKTKQLADHLKQQQEKKTEKSQKEVEKAQELGLTYEQYAARQKKKDQEPMSAKEWDAMEERIKKQERAKGTERKVDRQKGKLKDEISDAVSEGLTYADYVKRKKEEGKKPISKDEWEAIVDTLES